jgi:mRNA interferase MazF
LRIERGDVWLCEFDQHPDSRQNGVRPAVVVQTDHLNRVGTYTLTIVVPFSRSGSERIPSHAAVLPSPTNGLSDESFAKCEQLQTIPQMKLLTRKGKLSTGDLEAIDLALKRTLAL